MLDVLQFRGFYRGEKNIHEYAMTGNELAKTPLRVAGEVGASLVSVRLSRRILDAYWCSMHPTRWTWWFRVKERR
jgi:hypothetical protein